MGKPFRPTRPLLDRAGQPIIGPDGKPKRVPRSQNWFIRVYDSNGKARDIATGTALITKAKRMLHDLESAKGKGEPIGAHVGKITFDEAMRAVIADHTMNRRRSTDREQGRIDNHLSPAFTGRRMLNITSDVITAYVVARQAEGATSATVNRELQILRRAFRLAQRAGKLLTAPHIPKLQEPKQPRKGFFERAEFEATRGQLPVHLQPLLTFYYWTGWRSSEALSLEVRQVNRDECTVSLDPAQTKNGEGREFHFGPLDELRDVLTEQVASAERLSRSTGKIVTMLFHNADGSPLTKSLWRTAWEAARVAAGYPTKQVHDFRRTAARNYERAGVSRSEAMAMIGHKTESVYHRYSIVDEVRKLEAAEKLNVWATAKPAERKQAGKVRQFKRRAAGTRQ